MKKLKLLLVFLIIVLIALIYLQNKLYQEYNPKPSGETISTENKTDVINNNNFILEYNGYVYYINSEIIDKRFVNHLFRRNMQTNKVEVLCDFDQYESSDELVIYRNRIFYEVAGHTWSFNMDNLNTEEEFCIGQVAHLTDNDAISYFNGNIYLNQYYPTTYVVYNRSMLVRGHCSYIGKAANGIYFDSVDNNGNLSFFKIDYQNYDVSIIGNSELNCISGISLSQSYLSENYLYLVYESTKNEHYLVRVDLENGKSDYKSVPTRIANATTNKNELYFVTEKNDVMLYQENGEIIEKKIPKGVSNIYSLIQEDKKVQLFKNGVLLADISDETVGRIQNIHIAEISRKVYIKYDVIDEEEKLKDCNFYSINIDGSLLTKINE